RVGPGLAQGGIQAARAQAGSTIDLDGRKGARIAVQERRQPQARGVKGNPLWLPAFYPPVVTQVDTHHKGGAEREAVAAGNIPAIVWRHCPRTAHIVMAK